MGDVVSLPRELNLREVETAATELQRYLESTPAEGEKPSEFRQRFDKALASGAKLHLGAPAPDVEVTTWRLSPALNELLRRGTIRSCEHEAALRFLRDCFLGMQGGNPKTTNYAGASALGATSHDARETRRVHHRREFLKVFEALDRADHPALAWMIGTLGQAMPLQALGAYEAPDLGKQTQSARAGGTLSRACLGLCRHYGMKHPLDVLESLKDLSAKLSAQRIEHKKD